MSAAQITVVEMMPSLKLRAEAHALELLVSIQRLIAEWDNIEGSMDGVPLLSEPSCQDCTMGCTPVTFDKGPCAYHQALRLVRKIKREAV